MIFLSLTALVLMLIWLPQVPKDRERTIRPADVWLCCVTLGMVLLIAMIFFQLLSGILAVPSQT
jgi:hypothetical protein